MFYRRKEYYNNQRFKFAGILERVNSCNRESAICCLVELFHPVKSYESLDKDNV